MDGCDHTWVDSLILTRWLRPYYGSRLSCTLLWMAATIPHISCTWAISCLSQCRFSATVTYVLVKHFTPLSLGPHALGGICYTVICHHFSPSLLLLFCTLEDSFQDLWEVTKLETTCIMFPWVCTSCSLKTPPVKCPWKVPFFHWHRSTMYYSR